MTWSLPSANNPTMQCVFGVLSRRKTCSCGTLRSFIIIIIRSWLDDVMCSLVKPSKSCLVNDFYFKRVVLGAVSAPPGQLYGLEKFWAFLKYSKIKNQPIDPKLQEHLSQFKNLEDFRVVVSVQKWSTCFSNKMKTAVDHVTTLTFVSAAPDGRGGRQEETSLVLGRGWRKASATSFQLYLKTHAGLQILHRSSRCCCCCCTERHTQRKHPENIRRLLPGEEDHRAWSGEEGKCCAKQMKPLLLL